MEELISLISSSTAPSVSWDCSISGCVGSTAATARHSSMTKPASSLVVADGRRGLPLLFRLGSCRYSGLVSNICQQGFGSGWKCWMTGNSDGCRGDETSCFFQDAWGAVSDAVLPLVSVSSVSGLRAALRKGETKMMVDATATARAWVLDTESRRAALK